MAGGGPDTLRPESLPDLVRGTDIAWNPSRGRVVMFRTISALAITGTVGVTAIGESPDDASSLHREAGRLLQALARGHDPAQRANSTA